ncbi:MAG: hypothetical protein L0I76_20750 [Pseudonocardia sp.]|nr:hypothetical protein [Pseudonocardia sp.]
MTWFLLINDTDRRIDGALSSEVSEFARVGLPGDPSRAAPAPDPVGKHGAPPPRWWWPGG